MDKDTSEIVKLTERISRDPKSKLFVPLAEEYKKLGDIEMSIQVLTEGLKNNPGYVTARSFLGRLLLEKGDIAGAQKELEEVVKAIPDNLLAQRKLGDIFILQGRTKDALARYRAALTLNPGDKDIASLIADLDAGKDVSARISKPKIPPPPQEPPKPAAPAAAKPPSAAPAGTPALQPAVQPAPAGTVQQPGPPARAESPAGEVAEDVEEVLDLEPIEPAAAAAEAPATPIVASSEPAKQEPEAAEVTPPAAEQPEAKAGGFDFLVETGYEPEQAAGAEGRAPSFDLTGPAAAAGAGDAMAKEWEPTGTPAAEPAADEFNTNTLAELYIAQGFFDKAIEIYDQMFADQPGNRALKNKLDQIREMAGMAQASPPERPAPAAPHPFEPREYLPPAADGEAVSPAGADTAKAAEAAPEGIRPEPAVEAEGHAAGQGEEKSEPNAPSSADRAAGPKTPPARRKETIDRLEQWLSHIVKEKK